MPTQTISPESGYTNNGFYDTVSTGDGGNLHQVFASDGSFWIAQATTDSSTEHSIRFPLSTIAGVATVSKVSFAFTHRLADASFSLIETAGSYIDLFVGGVSVGEQTILTIGNSEDITDDYVKEFTGTWSKSDLDGMEVRFRGTSTVDNATLSEYWSLVITVTYEAPAAPARGNQRLSIGIGIGL